MDEQPEVIEREMQDTRHSLAEKLGALEGQVADTVQSTTHAVQGTTTAVTDTVETVKETVEDVSEKVMGTVAAMEETVEAVKDGVQDAFAAVSSSIRQATASVGEALDLGLQAERRPWLVFGGSVAVGCLGGYLLGRTFSRSEAPARNTPWRPPSGPTGDGTAGRQAEAFSGGGSWMPGWVSDELGRLRKFALGAAMSVVRDLARQNIPGTMGERIAEEVEAINGKLGGEKFSGPILPTADGQRGNAG